MQRSLAKQDTLVANDANWSMMKTLAKKYKQNCKLCGTYQSFIAAPIKLSPSQKNVPKSNYLPIYFRSSLWTFATWLCYQN